METMRYEVTGVSPTISPSMDIQVSSNFERLLFTANERDGAEVARMMDGLKQSGSFTIQQKAFDRITEEFSAGRCSEEETARTIKTDPCGKRVSARSAHSGGTESCTGADARGVPMVTLATAHSAKFPDAVKPPAAVRPALPLWQGDLMRGKRNSTVIENDEEG